MADSNKTIRIDVIVDDKGNVSIDKLTSSVKDLGKENEVTKDSQVSLVQQIQKLQSASKRTADVIKKEIALTTKLNDSTKTTNKAYLEGVIGVQKLERELNDLTKTQSRVILSGKTTAKNLGNIKSATGSASGAVVELGRTISDSNYGFPAMANNVQQLATQMSFLVKEEKGVRGAFRQLGKAMSGAGGILLLLSVAISLFENMALNARKTKEELKDINEELAKSQGTIENLEVLAEIYRNSEEDTNRYNLALGKLKKEGFDDTKGSLEEFLEVKKAEREFDIKQEPLLKKRQEQLKEEIRLKGEIEKLEKSISAGFQEKKEVTYTKGGTPIIETTTIEEQKLAAETALSALRSQMALNGASVTATNIAIRDNFNEMADSLKDNPLFYLVSGLKPPSDDDDGEGREDVISAADQIGRMVTSEEQLERRKDLMGRQLEVIAEFFGVELGLTSKHFDLLKLLRKKDVNDEEASQEAKFKALMTYVDGVSFLGQTLTQASENNEKLAIAGIIIEKSAAIAGIIASTRKANAQVLGRYGGSLTASKPERTANTISAGLAIGAVGLSAVTAIKDIKSKNEGGTQSISEPPTPTIQAPDFNVVGASQESQLAQTIAGAEEQPLRAYVVAEDVTTAQQLDRKIIEGASLG